MSAIRAAVIAEFPRLRALWPVLETKTEHLAEIGKAVMRHESRLTPEDISRGFDRVIQESPTTAWPPGPHEVLGCILRERDARRVTVTATDRGRPGSGLSFAEWWHSLPEPERAKHEALCRVMGRGDLVTSSPPASAGAEADSW